MSESTWHWQRRRNPFRERLNSGEPGFIVGIDVPWTPLVEIAASAGADAAFIDLEHTTLSLTDVENLIVGCDAAGIGALVRPAGLDGRVVSRMLDSGAHGVIYPDLKTGAEVEQAVAATRYPPGGTRPWGGAHTRSVMWEGVLASRALRETDVVARGNYSDEFVTRTARDVHVTVLVESPEGVGNLPDMVKVPGVDAFWFGWADFAAHVRFDLAACEAAAESVYRICREAGVSMCLAVDEVEIRPWYPGCYYFAGLDTLLLANAMRVAVSGAKQRVQKARILAAEK